MENEYSRKIIGFDIFGDFPEAKEIKSDRDFVAGWNQAMDYLISEDDIYQSLEQKGIGNVELVKGNILDTLKEYFLKNGQGRIALLHIDTDVYEPSKYGLEMLYDKVVPGGLIVLDDYSIVEGETRAADEFFAGKSYKLKKFPFSHTKPVYIVKE